MVNKLSHITTYSKIHFNPIDPKAEDIKIEDIAHALSLLCRANGHFERFFSVAQHSINCAKEAAARRYTKRVQLACLLHDASEAYISDITRPVKPYLPKYLEFEKRLQNMIWEKFLGGPLNADEQKLVFEIDDAEFFHEFLHFMGEKAYETPPVLMGKPDYETRDFKSVENRFLSVCRSLTENRD